MKHIYILSLMIGIFSTSCNHNVERSQNDDSSQVIVADAHAPIPQIHNNNIPQNTIPAGVRILEDATPENTLPSFFDKSKFVQADKLVKTGYATPEEELTLRSLFRQFQTAVLTYDPNAVHFLSDSSIQYYDNLLKVVKLATFDPKSYNVTKNNIPIGVRTNAEIIKTRLSTEFIAKATPVELYQTAFQQGWIGHNTFQSASVDNFQAFDNNGKRYITADFYYDGTVKDEFVARIGFTKDTDSWKVDLLPIFMAIEKAIELKVQQGKIKPDVSIDATVQETQKNLDQDNWPPFSSNIYNFIAHFPNTPVHQNDPKLHVDAFTVSDHRYGQFGVLIQHFDLNDPLNPYQKPDVERAYISNAIKSLNGSSPDCRQTTHGSDHAVYCYFDADGQTSKILIATFVTPNKSFRVFNQAPNALFNLDVAQKFIASFDYSND